MRTGLYSQDDDMAGMAEVSSDDGRETEWAPMAEPDSPGSYKELGEVSGGKKLQSSKKRAKCMHNNITSDHGAETSSLMSLNKTCTSRVIHLYAI